MAAIVISYRREDSQATTGRIFDRLEHVYGPGHVFMDIDNIPFGADFRQHLQETLDRCDILLVIVGPRWLARRDNGTSRLFEEVDWVRLEVATALKKQIPVIPVLVEGAKMPNPSELPADLESFAFRQAATIDIGVDFRAHMERLTKSMDRILTSKKPEELPDTSEGAIAADEHSSSISQEPNPSGDARSENDEHAPTLEHDQKAPSEAGRVGDKHLAPASMFGAYETPIVLLVALCLSLMLVYLLYSTSKG